MTDKRETSDGERGIVTMHVEAYKVGEASGASETSNGEPSEPRDEPDGDDTLVCEFDRTALSLKRPE